MQDLLAGAKLAVRAVGCFSLIKLNRTGTINLVAKGTRPDELLAKSTKHGIAIGNMVGHLHLDDVGAPVGQLPNARRPGPSDGQIDDSEVGQRQPVPGNGFTGRRVNIRCHERGSLGAATCVHRRVDGTAPGARRQ